MAIFQQSPLEFRSSKMQVHFWVCILDNHSCPERLPTPPSFPIPFHIPMVEFPFESFIKHNMSFSEHYCTTLLTTSIPNNYHICLVLWMYLFFATAGSSTRLHAIGTSYIRSRPGERLDMTRCAPVFEWQAFIDHPRRELSVGHFRIFSSLNIQLRPQNLIRHPEQNWKK